MTNTTIASFSTGSPFATAQTLVWEYDQTQYLQIEGLSLPYSCSVDFCNIGDSSTITMPCVQGKAEIPDDFFKTGKNIKAYVVLTDDASVQTRYEIVIPVIKRPTRTDIQPTPAEQQQIDALIQALSDGVDAADAAADAAEASAVAALASEQAAQASASEADQAASSAAESVADVRAYAQEAEQAATAAAMSESNAEASAQASAASAQSASDSATSAADSASAAADAVSDAAGYANEASQHATAAEQYADNASGYASDASDSAADAAQKAADASASATAAAQSADNASAKASEALQSAANASTSATAAATSATNAANAQTAAETAQGKAEDAQEAAETAQTAAEQAAQEVETALVNKADVIIDTASGPIASFTDGADGAPMVSIVCEINPVQSGSGDPSPTNVRPISGFTGLTLSHSGADTSNPTTYQISWQSEAGTVFGGTLDATTGVLTVDRAMIVFDGTESANWLITNGTTIQTVYTVPATLPSVNTSGFQSNAVFNIFKTITTLIYGRKVGDAYIDTGYMNLVFAPNTFANVADFKTWLNSNNLQVVYELAHPQTYQLDPVTVETLLGQNNIWHDANGDTNATYRADTKLYIQKINAPTDDDMTADAQIASGKYFIIGGNLYLSTTTIPAGDTIIPGTNCVLTNLAEALNALI